MEKIIIIITLILIGYISIKLINKAKTNQLNNNNLNENKNIKYRTKEKYITTKEQYFYEIIKNNFKDYNVYPQIPLSSIIEKQKQFKNEYQNELYRTIDIGIFDKSYKPILLIEINDKTHNTINRKSRDIKVKEICKQANIKLITFWTSYSNTKEYIIKKIKEELCISGGD